LSNILGFDQRLRQAFLNAPISEIAAKLELSYHGARNYFEGRIPSAEKLKQISELTGYSIHWLLTGQGPKTTEGYPADETPLILENHIQEALNGLAAEEKKNTSEIIAHLITEALIERGLVNEELPTAQFRFYRMLNTHFFKTLTAFFTFRFSEDPTLTSPESTSSRSNL
jgi:transcriptional regulator with XRE-family HTH domain